MNHPGLSLTAVENADGTWNILDVPIMPPVPAGSRMNDEEIGVDWMRKAVETARVEHDLGHLGSLGVFHHPDLDIGASSKPAYAGKILPTRVGVSRMREGSVPCLYCDFLFVPSEIVDRIERHELSYRSPEVVNWAKFRIDNVVLLSTEPPFFRLPMLGIGERIPYGGRTEETFDSQESFVAARFSDRTSPIYRFSEEFAMPKDEKPTAKMGDGEDKKEEDDDAKMEDGGLNAESIIKAIESGEIPVKDFDAIKAAISAREGGAEEIEEEPIEDKDIGQTPVQMTDAKTLARMTALEEFRDNTMREKRLTARMDGAVAKFSEAGIQMSKRVRQSIAKFADGSSDEDFEEYVGLLLDELPKDSAARFDDAVDRARPVDSDVVSKFAAQGPDALMKARKLSAAFHRAARLGLRSTEDQFIAANWDTKHI